jgi:hypothetical protein
MRVSLDGRPSKEGQLAVHIATVLLTLMAVYLGIGVLFGVPFVARLVNQMDPAAAAGTWGFRLLILPGVIALWPLVLLRLVRSNGAPPRERNAHRLAARVETGEPRP